MTKIKEKNNINVAKEYNFDGLVGPTHNYADLFITDNLAAMANRQTVSNPRAAALEGLEKMKFLMDLGYPQAVLPPHARPDLSFLKQMGFSGSTEKILRSVQKVSNNLLASCYASSSMWAANSVTVSPSADTQDGRVHFTPANLNINLHRSLEAKQTSTLLNTIFADRRFFVHHPPVFSHPTLSDEGAANHIRFCSNYGSAGVEVFVYGRKGFSNDRINTFYPRQTKEASELIMFHHRLSPQRTFIVKQHPKAIAAGAFHNDVVCSVDRNLIFYYELAFANEPSTLQKIKKALAPTNLLQIKIKENQLSLKEIVTSYLFNSQLLPINELPGTFNKHNLQSCNIRARNRGEVTPPLGAAKVSPATRRHHLHSRDMRAAESRRNHPPLGGGGWILVAPEKCKKVPAVKDYIQQLPSKEGPIKKVHFISIRQSMLYGGGPACLRLRVVLTEEEARHMHQGVQLTQKRYQQLKKWIHKHYRDRLRPDDLLDPLLIRESQEALDELTSILKLKNIYPFQKTKVI